MAPSTFSKRRRRDEDDSKSRPKKKFKKVKHQAAYHSSSEDEDDNDERDSGAFRARDAPVNPHSEKTPGRAKPVRKERKIVDKKASSAKDTTKLAANTKSIPKPKEQRASNGSKLAKSSVPTQPSDSESDEGSDGEDEDANLDTKAALSAIQTDDLDEEEEPENLSDLDLEDDEPALESSASSDEEEDQDEDEHSETESTTSSQAARTRKKRNDPDAFATSISKILDTKLSTAKRSDPVLSRSRSAQEANRAIADEKLEQKARAQLRAERKIASEKGRVRDILGLQTPDVDTGAIVELEKRLKKTAQRGVVKLFNAVRAAQVKGEEAMRQAKSAGVVGMQQREEKASEMSKQGFLDLISSGGKKPPPAVSA